MTALLELPATCTMTVTITTLSKKVGYFSPLTLVGLRVPTVAPTTGVSVTVLLEQTYYFTFRNPKFGGDPAATASLY